MHPLDSCPTVRVRQNSDSLKVNSYGRSSLITRVLSGRQRPPELFWIDAVPRDSAFFQPNRSGCGTLEPVKKGVTEGVRFMSKRLSDFSQLARSMFPSRKDPPAEVKTEPVRAAASEAGGLDEAYFLRRSAGMNPLPGKVAEPVHPETERLAEIEAELAAKTSALELVTAEKLSVEREVAGLREALESSRREAARLEERCTRLQCDLQAAAGREGGVEPPAAAPVPSPRAEKVFRGLLAPVPVEELFPGEMREIVIDALTDSYAQAEQAGRERRAALLKHLLAGNSASGELARRGNELRQILKDAGSFTDTQTIKALEKLGFRLVSGRKHWKIAYGTVRLPLAKTPSDFRSNRNAVSEIVNRCF